MRSCCRTRSEPKIERDLEGKTAEVFEEIRRAVAKYAGVPEDQVVMLIHEDDLMARLERMENDPETELQ